MISFEIYIKTQNTSYRLEDKKVVFVGAEEGFTFCVVRRLVKFAGEDSCAERVLYC